MTATITPTSGIAALVTEHAWQHPSDPEGQLRRHRVAHVATGGCRYARTGTPVAHDVDITTAEAGTPCDYCWPSRPEPHAPTMGATAAVEPQDRRPVAAAPDSTGAARRPAAVTDGPEPSENQAGWYRHLVACVTVLRDGQAIDPETLAQPHVEAAVEAAVEAMRRKGTWTRPGVSAAIGRGEAAVRALGHDPRTPRRDTHSGDTLPDVAEGHYAIRSSGANDLAFYRVDRPTEGPWAGGIYVKLIVGGHPAQRVRRDAVRGILERIAADPDAGPRYGREIGRCCRCNRTLTDDTSRAQGIGPECRKRA